MTEYVLVNVTDSENFNSTVFWARTICFVQIYLQTEITFLHSDSVDKLNMTSLIVLFALLALSEADISIGQCPVTGANNPDFDPEQVTCLFGFCFYCDIFKTLF